MSEDLAHYVYQKWFEITEEDENDFLYPKDDDSKEAMEWIFKNTKYKKAEEFKNGLIEEIRKRIVEKIEVRGKLVKDEKGIEEYYDDGEPALYLVLDKAIIKVKPRNEKWANEMKKYVNRPIYGIQGIFDFMVAQEIYNATVTGTTIAFDFLISPK